MATPEQFIYNMNEDLDPAGYAYEDSVNQDAIPTEGDINVQVHEFLAELATIRALAPNYSIETALITQVTAQEEVQDHAPETSNGNGLYLGNYHQTLLSFLSR